MILQNPLGRRKSTMFLLLVLSTFAYGDENICEDIDSSVVEVEIVAISSTDETRSIEIVVPAHYGSLRLHHGTIALQKDGSTVFEADLAFAVEEDKASFYVIADAKSEVGFVATYIGSCTSKLRVPSFQPYTLD